MTIKTVGIIGAGTMGNGIAHTAAASGFDVTLIDVAESFLERGMSTIASNLQRGVDKGKMTSEEKQQVLGRIRATSDIAAAANADIVIEAIIESLAAKTQLFAQLDALTGSECILASNTSSISITKIAAATKRPDKVIGMHFFNPATIMKLVEVVTTDHTNENTKLKIMELADRIGKTAVLCKDAPGFIVNHVARPFYLEALRLAEEKITDMGTMDKVLESAGFKMGPFHLMDLIGNDINYTVSHSLYEALGKPSRLKPSALQENMVKQGLLGRKTGSGFFHYTKPPAE